MKKILVIAVTYHSDKELQMFLESVRCAAERVKDTMQVDVEVADNGQNNKGYLGGAQEIYNQKAQGYDYVSISNVDLQVEEDFFEQLVAVDTKDLSSLVRPQEPKGKKLSCLRDIRRAWVVYAIYQSLCERVSGIAIPRLYVRRRDLHGRIGSSRRIESSIHTYPAHCQHW